MKYNIVCIFKAGDQRDDCGFGDVITPIWNSLRRLGHSVTYSRDIPHTTRRNIVFGICLNTSVAALLNEHDIIVNLEQYDEQSKWFTHEYIEILKQFDVWEYSKKNRGYLRKLYDIRSKILELGFDPGQECLEKNFPKDIDVLFYGAMNYRRAALLNKLASDNIKIFSTTNAYGRERDELIARAKLILNVHYYQSAILEIPRLSYLWANHKAIISETSAPHDMYPHLHDACHYCAYEDLREHIHMLLKDEAGLEELSERGYTRFASRSMDECLEPLAGRESAICLDNICPEHMNIGSGKQFRTECINLDINPAWNPDAVLDICTELQDGYALRTERFGNIGLHHGYFSKIYLHDVLEHLPDLIKAMSNIINLAAVGGEVEIIVPYDLSYGAWQDPTHVRAFNEKSWRYYTDWSWYIGWREFCFDLVALEYILNRKFDNSALLAEELPFKPRAVDSMRVVLKKRRTTEKEQRQYDCQHGTFYARHAGLTSSPASTS